MPDWVEPVGSILLGVLLLVVPFLWLGGYLVSLSAKPRSTEPALDADVPRAQVVSGGHSPLREPRPAPRELTVRLLLLALGLVSLCVGLACAMGLVFVLFIFYS